MNLASLFFERARCAPHHTALAFADHTLTYGALAEQALALAAAVGEARICGLLAQRSDSAYAGVLGALAAGAAYVPLNPAFPPARNAYIAHKAGIHTLIVGPECADALAGLLAASDCRFQLLSLGDDATLAQLVAAHPERLTWQVARARALQPRPLPADALAYVLFTSGSTGQPKGVCVRHRNVQGYVQRMLTLLPVTPDDRISQTFDLTFDLSVHDMFVTWAAGATLVVYPDAALTDPLPYTARQRVSVWFSVPSLAAMLESLRQAQPNALPELRLSLFCGEKLSWNTWRVWRSIAPRSRVFNLYGPTEATIAITQFEVPADLPEQAALHGVIPIGEPLPGQRVALRRPDGSVCAPGEAGALYLAGDQLSAGYLGEPQLTAERFAPRDGELWYRTGDVALRDAAGQLQFLGRDDAQVKIMGYRVELGEVEHALLQASGAAAALAGVLERDGVPELYAALPGELAPHKRAIREALRARLPGYMQPRRYVFLPSFPRNASGKLDRKAVQALVLSAADAGR